MAYGYGNGYGLTRGTRTAHPAAAAYRNSLIALGTTPSGAQMVALSTFFRAADTGGWRSALACLFLPVWGAAAPNAVDAITLTSGTFVGTVSHTGKQFQGTGGTPGYFNTNCTPASLGLAIQGAGAGLVYPAAPVEFNIDSGARGTPSVDDILHYWNGTYMALNLGSGFYQAPITSRAMVMHWNSNATAITFGGTAGTQESGTFGVTGAGALPTVPIFLGAFNNNTVATGQTGRALTGYAAWRTLTQAQANALATALFNLTTALRA